MRWMRTVLAMMTMMAATFSANAETLSLDPSLIHKIGGQLVVNGVAITADTDDGYRIEVTRPDGTPLSPVAETTEVLASGKYVLYIPCMMARASRAGSRRMRPWPSTSITRAPGCSSASPRTEFSSWPNPIPDTPPRWWISGPSRDRAACRAVPRRNWTRPSPMPWSIGMSAGMAGSVFPRPSGPFRSWRASSNNESVSHRIASGGPSGPPFSFPRKIPSIHPPRLGFFSREFSWFACRPFFGDFFGCIYSHIAIY